MVDTPFPPISLKDHRRYRQRRQYRRHRRHRRTVYDCLCTTPPPIDAETPHGMRETRLLSMRLWCLCKVKRDKKPEARNRETGIPPSGGAFPRPAERPKDGRGNAEEKPAKTRIASGDPRGSRNRGGRPPDAHHGEPKARDRCAWSKMTINDGG